MNTERESRGNPAEWCTTNVPPFRLLTKREVAAIFCCTERTIDRMISARSIPFIQIPTGVGRRTRRRFDLRDIEQ
jgi:predicted DNA-binding transcriptional regulator AlpA